MVRLAVAAALVLGSAALGASSPAHAGDSHALIQGSGSSWAENAIDQWIADVKADGLQVVFTGSGSAQGRKDFANRTTDFADSEIGYQGYDPGSQTPDTSQGREYAYLPVVGGGTSFPYQIKFGGKAVTNLRLSGETIARIFTNQITNWDDPAITHDNNGRQLGSLPIIPVVHSEGSGSSAQFTKYLANQYPGIWSAYSGTSTFTEYYPRKGAVVAQNGSSQVINYVESKAANGAIGYDEYSYALLGGYPVAKMLNKAGYYTLPTQYNVAVALTKAIINEDKSSPNYLLQDLHRVYVATDKRTYPLSSYSYGIIPTGNPQSKPPETKMTTAKRQTLADFLYYAICPGQKEVGPIGYSPLPVNLVTAGFSQIGKLKQADSGVDLTRRSVGTCANPTFVAGHPNENYLAKIAPAPPACDKAGAGPCVTGTTVAANNAGTGSSNGSGSASSKGGSSSNGAASPGATAPPGSHLDPITGEVVPGSADSSGIDAALVPTTLSSYRYHGRSLLLAPLAVALLVAAVLTPPILAPALERRRRRRDGSP